MHHLRDSVRHMLAAVLMLGTLAGTVWTFSAGALTLSGAWERIVSVGGIAAALECGVIYVAWYLGQLDQRIKASRRREFTDSLKVMRADLERWFYAVAAISAVANFLFRREQLHNTPLAAFVSVAPIVLVVLFLVKLRPLPDDYADIGARATGRALVRIVEESERTVLHRLRQMGRGRQLSDEEMRQLAMNVRLIGTYARIEESRALDSALQLAAPAVVVVDAEAEPYLRTADIAARYGVSTRTAQGWMARCANRRRVPNSNAWEAPESAVLAACGTPHVRDSRQDSVAYEQDRAMAAQASAATAYVVPLTT